MRFRFAWEMFSVSFVMQEDELQLSDKLAKQNMQYRHHMFIIGRKSLIATDSDLSSNSVLIQCNHSRKIKHEHSLSIVMDILFLMWIEKICHASFEAVSHSFHCRIFVNKQYVYSNLNKSFKKFNLDKHELIPITVF